MSIREETQGQTQDTLERLHLLASLGTSLGVPPDFTGILGSKMICLRGKLHEPKASLMRAGFTNPSLWSSLTQS